ncbi:unnamed protein product [Zymoseptoria tritici ST99CH_1A5]|uniref:Methylated-DNA--protein-cysteine methyltransferase n=1 Tax=Zymoseptoria tritici ST99CH_1A5 TaxID=1276529 RepID=A0A1Y6LQN2_ZYMTR|nr:unnamed protein product [Zymoseptoria tritici ST99CH_1A5]
MHSYVRAQPSVSEVTSSILPPRVITSTLHLHRRNSRPSKMTTLTPLQSRWKHLYHTHLPALAKARAPAQPTWPVYLDHCFARIVLDNAVGKDRPWTEVVKAPAIKNMTEVQLEDAIRLAEEVVSGEADLVELDERSLRLRGKKGKKRKGGGEEEGEVGRKKGKLEVDQKSKAIKKESKVEDYERLPARAKESKVEDDEQPPATKKPRPSKKNETISSYFLPSPTSPNNKQSANPSTKTEEPPSQAPQQTQPNLAHHLHRIQSSSALTPFRKQTLSLLLQIPPGQYSTYGALAAHISATSHKTCARAVGSSMRNNPFAPEVPCHRILAGDGSLGGFGGDWGEEGRHAGEKRRLLREEGVRFDEKGKVKGLPFRDFK